jgi:hypothetical protein
MIKMSTLNTKSSYALRALVLSQWVVIGALWNVKPTESRLAATVGGVLIFYVVSALVCISIIIDWFTRREVSRQYAKLIDSFLWLVWVISMAYLILYSLQMGTL